MLKVTGITMTISYDEYNKRVTQDLGYISTYELEGDFDKVIENIKKEYEYYSEYLTKGHKIKEENYQGGAYLDGTSEKVVSFDRIYIDCVDTYDNGKEFRIRGQRGLNAEELVALEAKNKVRNAKREVEEKEQLKKLKEKYPDA